METIYKYKLDRVKESIALPVGAQVLTVAMQGNDICIWAKIDKNNHPECRRFTIYGTGWDIIDNGNHKFIGTIFEGQYVWHVFEILGQEG